LKSDINFYRQFLYKIEFKPIRNLGSDAYFEYTSCYFHRLSINRPTKRGKEKSPSDGHCQCEKEMDDHLLACQYFLKKSYIVTRFAKEGGSFLNMNDINDISFFGTCDCLSLLFYSVSRNASSMFISK
jgi:hypothetical protein